MGFSPPRTRTGIVLLFLTEAVYTCTPTSSGAHLGTTFWGSGKEAKPAEEEAERSLPPSLFSRLRYRW